MAHLVGWVYHFSNGVTFGVIVRRDDRRHALSKLALGGALGNRTGIGDAADAVSTVFRHPVDGPFRRCDSQRPSHFRRDARVSNKVLGVAMVCPSSCLTGVEKGGIRVDSAPRFHSPLGGAPESWGQNNLPTAFM